MALQSGSRLLFSALHTNDAGEPPSTPVTARPESLPLASGEKLSVSMWVLSPRLWEDLLVEHGLLIDQFSLITAPEVDSPVSCTLIHARRPPA
ncbi:hypothetical protein OH805_37265 [Streptomyces sp. NBC_00879]|uniref:hypothetical protein n=1 Tax=Streptomyces sp. NBC_00879 TaxID=2975855 RepID=UPI003863A626|nr:hypothetical protein OH805_37265 [Streptomyces sp. NBC_00879]